MINSSGIEKKTNCRGIALTAIIFISLLIAAPASGQLTSDDIAAMQKRAADEGWTFTVGENPATQYSLDQLCGLKVPDGWWEGAKFDPCTPTKELPAAYDWRDSDGCTPVKNQGGCGSCWAFATVGPLECNIKIKDGITVDLSEQWLVSCNSDGWDCGGGWWAHDYHEWKTDPCDSTGAVPESEFVYAASDLPCGCPYTHPYKIESWTYVGNSYSVPSVDAMKQAILDYGPISVAVVANSAMQAYTGGIFGGCTSGTVNHGVVLVGWDDNQGSNGVWIMRNSWGSGWGESGYMRIPYGCSLIGYAACYIDYAGTRGLVFDYPDGIPSFLVSDQTNSFEVVITGAGGGELIPNSPQLHYSVNGGEYVSDVLTHLSSARYRATFPPISCPGTCEFYISAEESETGIFFSPAPAAPNFAFVAEESINIFTDDFETDQGWTVSGNASDGQWERGVPVGGGDRGDPPADYDGSGYCYLTDNVDDNSDVDNGTTYLDSPIFDLSDGDAAVSYARWYSNDYGSAPSSDVMRIYLSNNGGGNWTLVDSAGPTEQSSGGWYEHAFWSGDFLAPTDQMMLRFEVSDLGDGSVVEAGVDAVSIVTYSCGSTPGPLEITTESVPDWTAEYPYSVQLNSTGGVGVHMWVDKYGDLFGTGLSLSVEGLLSGTVPEGMVISFTAEVTDEEDITDEAVFTFTINDALSITTTSLPDWTEGVPYSELLASDGGTGGKTWLDKYADLIGTGLSLDVSGPVSGTPTSVGPVSFTAEVADQVGASAETVFSFTVNPAPDITTAALPEAGNGEVYSSQLEASGGTATMTWTDRDGDLSGTGLILAADGLLSGTPVDTGTIDFTARVVDAVGGSDEQGLTLSVVQYYVCGDANGDTEVNTADAVYLINYLFKDGSPPDPLEAGDANCDGEVNIADGVWIINFVFKDGPEPCCP